jgi:choline dehydrogenase
MGGYWDTVIVGAGSAGCVLAARLSEDAARRVLLLEAGPDYPTAAELPPELVDAGAPAWAHDWGYRSEAGALGRPIDLNRAKVVGGCSATNATFALRGNPSDYDRWAALGNPGWGFDDVLPFLCKLETDLDFGGPWHGDHGPVRVRRYTDAELTPAQQAFLEACNAAGVPGVEDHNQPGASGAGKVPVNAVGGVRQSAALAYLGPARGRPNLSIRAGELAAAVVIEGTTVTGVRLAGGEVLGAGEVIISAGASGSPALLLRSGIGPAADLAQLGIVPVVDLPGVGSGLTDHPLAEIAFAASGNAPKPLPAFQAVLTASSARARTAEHDLQVFPMSAGAAGPSVVCLFASVTLPVSQGQVALRSVSPEDPPCIDLGLLRDPADRAALAEAEELARALAATPPFRDLVTRELLPDAPIAERTSTYHHPVGTCRMGPASDPDAVVDSTGRVHGIGGLRVVDASIMPAIPAANTNLPTMMVAERIASFITE